MFKDKSMVGYYDGLSPGLMVREPDLAKAILQTNFQNFHENGNKIDPELDPLAAKNPFFSIGNAWLTGRKRLTYAFSSMKLKILSETVQGVCKKFENYLERKVQPNERASFEMKDLFSRFTGEVVANAGFGIEGFCFEDDDTNPQSFREIGRKIFEPSVLVGMIQAIVFFLPILNKVFKIRFIPKEIDRFFRTVVHQVLENRKNENVARKDFFQLMIDLEKSEGEKFDEESLAGHALSFFVDGYETSSATMSFIIFELSIHQDIQEKLREEIMRVTAKHNNEINYESIKEMTYLDQVICESQRVNTLLNQMHKICTNECELRGSDGLVCKVEPGVKILIPVHDLQRDPLYWSDPETFDPDRWNEERKDVVNKYAFLPFGEGPRICVGMRMALLQTKAAIATLLRKYKIERNPRTTLPVKLSVLGLLTTPEEGLWTYLRRI